MSSAPGSAGSGLREQPTTVAPALSSSWAIPTPTPRLVPVTTATLPSNTPTGAPPDVRIDPMDRQEKHKSFYDFVQGAGRTARGRRGNDGSAGDPVLNWQCRAPCPPPAHRAARLRTRRGPRLRCRQD